MGTLAWALTAVAGLIVGAGLGFWIGKLTSIGSAEKLKQAEDDLADYKAQVSDHFRQSANHFQAIGEQYRALYEHMAAGSQSLCGPDVSGKLAFPKPADAPALTAATDASPAADAPSGIEAGDDATEASEAAADAEPTDQLGDDTENNLAAANLSVVAEDASRVSDDEFDGSETIATTSDAVEPEPAANEAGEADDIPVLVDDGAETSDEIPVLVASESEASDDTASSTETLETAANEEPGEPEEKPPLTSDEEKPKDGDRTYH